MLGKFEDTKGVGNNKQRIEEGPNRKQTKGQTLVYKAPLRKPYTEQHNTNHTKSQG